ncbi:MAG: hypothetical protein ABJF23_12745 [Bryobacteraceae bacterium]
MSISVLKISFATQFLRLRAFVERHDTLTRSILFAYALLIACPVRYWPLGSGVDETWRFALNYAPVHGMMVGRDIIFTCGPLAYLIFPQHIGNNLAQGLLFQAGLWIVLAAILADVFFRGGFALRNLAMFSVFFGLAGPLFWVNYLGPESLMLAGALLLIVMFQLHGSLWRYLAALAIIGLLPLFKLTAGMIGVTALGGFLVERILCRGWKAIRELVLAAFMPAAVTVGLCFLVIPSTKDMRTYLRGSSEMISGFSSAMSVWGPRVEILSALEATVVLMIIVGLLWVVVPGKARFYTLFLAGPLFISFKHGFTRQDNHVINFFCFLALALALVSLAVSLGRERNRFTVVLVILFFVMWQDNVSGHVEASLIGQVTGIRAARMLWGAAHFDRLRKSLDSSIAAFPEELRIEPELAAIVGGSPVASLSAQFTNLFAAHMHLELYPVVQRYSAYTPYLDGLNASWIRDKGPRFLVFDGQAIDDRDAWAETPATWLEVYRWYDTRWLGPRNLLLERRAQPRFSRLETISRFRLTVPAELHLPTSRDAVFWTMQCDYSTKGRILKLLFRILPTFMTVNETGRASLPARILPAVLVSPVLGNYLPRSLARFAAVFQPGAEAGPAVESIHFDGIPGSAYASSCAVELLRPVL